MRGVRSTVVLTTDRPWPDIESVFIFVGDILVRRGGTTAAAVEAVAPQQEPVIHY